MRRIASFNEGAFSSRDNVGCEHRSEPVSGSFPQANLKAGVDETQNLELAVTWALEFRRQYMRGISFALRQIDHLRVIAFGYSPERWDGLFQSGSYDRLESVPERAHYSLIVGHCDVLGAESILDVGCGQGVLAGRLKRAQYNRYVGLDISPTAIDQARQMLPDPRNTYLATDAEKFSMAEQFDLIVFNESLYYFEDPVAMVKQYLEFLRPDGHLSISMCKSARSRLIWKLLDAHLTTIEPVDVNYKGGGSWTVKLMQPSLV